MRLMLVEDEAVIRNGLKKLIETIIGGYQVVAEADSGKSALDVIRKTLPDLIITDIRMKDMNGLELIERLKDQYGHIHTLILSGHQDFAYAKKAIQFGVHDYLLKPVDRVELAHCLEKIKNIHQNGLSKNSTPDLLGEELEREGYLIQKIKQIIHSRIDQDVSLTYVAEQVNLNPQYLSTLFKTSTGQKYIDYIISYRVEKAKQLLADTHLKIYEIGFLVGYSNMKHFYNIFRKEAGITPSEFRKNSYKAQLNRTIS
jgi:two-component system response regulator YesN